MAWLTTSKIARKAGHVQTAYSAILQAMALHAPFTFVQQAKLMRANGQPLKALSELENILPTLRLDSTMVGLSGQPIQLDEDPVQSRESVALAKVSPTCNLMLKQYLIRIIRLCPSLLGGLSKPSDSKPMTSSSVSCKLSGWRPSKHMFLEVTRSSSLAAPSPTPQTRKPILPFGTLL